MMFSFDDKYIDLDALTCIVAKIGPVRVTKSHQLRIGEQACHQQKNHLHSRFAEPLQIIFVGLVGEYQLHTWPWQVGLLVWYLPLRR